MFACIVAVPWGGRGRGCEGGSVWGGSGVREVVSSGTLVDIEKRKRKIIILFRFRVS
jgi:hypothetical protein